MLAIVDSVRLLIKDWLGNEAAIHFVTSWFHYRLTVTGLLLWSLLLLVPDHFDQKLSCYQGDSPFYPEKMVNDICRTNDLKTKGAVLSYLLPSGADKEVYLHNYYPWVVIFLWFQALLFYLPHCFWISQENGKVQSLVLDLGSATVDEDTKRIGLEQQVKFFTTRMGTQRRYALTFCMSQCMFLINVVGQFFLVGAFLGESIDFANYGLDVWNNMHDPAYVMRLRFPFWATCTLEKFGPSGTLQHVDAACHLPRNMFNGIFFLITWCWLLILGAITVISLIYWSLFFCWN